MWEQTLAVLLVLGLLSTTLWLLRRKGVAGMRFGLTERSRAQKQLEVMERVVLTPQHSLHLVRVRDQLVLVGLSPGSCSHLQTFPGLAEARTAGSREESP